MRYTVVKEGDQQNVVFFSPETGLLNTDSNNPNFDEIVSRLANGETEGVADLFDPSHVVSAKFEALSERVSVAGGRVYFDGDPLDGVLADQILRFVKAGVDDWQPLVNFYENLAANPSEHSRENLYRWLRSEDFSIDQDGMIVGYRYVQTDKDGNYVSCATGSAMVDGVPHTGHIPNPIGAVVTMPRSAVNHDPNQGCSYGLHVGTWGYSGNNSQTVLEVRVNPRDVVSVPTEANGGKMRVCRFEVKGLTKSKNTSPVVLDLAK